MSRLTPETLPSAVKKRLAPVYVITGDEPLLVQESCDAIRAQAKKMGFTEREIYHAEGNFNWDNLLHSANSLSLFADKKILELRIPNGKPNDSGNAIVEYCEGLSEDNLLIVICPKLDKRTQSSKWYQALDKSGDVVTVWPVTIQQLPRWVDQRLKAAGLQADSNAIDILCAKVEGNLLAAAQEIEKLKLLARNNLVDANLMAAAVMDSARFDVFGLVDKALAGDSRAAANTLQGLKSEGTEATVVLWALTREIRILATIKDAMELGTSFDLAAKQNGVWDKRKPTVRHALNRMKPNHLHGLIRKASLTDQAVKGMAKGDVWNLLLDITLSLSGTNTFSAKTQKTLLQFS